MSELQLVCNIWHSEAPSPALLTARLPLDGPPYDGGNIRGNPILADLDGNGDAEIIIAMSACSCSPSLRGGFRSSPAGCAMEMT